MKRTFSPSVCYSLPQTNNNPSLHIARPKEVKFVRKEEEQEEQEQEQENECVYVISQPFLIFTFNPE